MTPVGSRGGEGYPDWQKVVNWDGPTIVDENAGTVTGTKTFGPFSTSRYGYLAGRLGVAENPVLVELNWWTDEGLTKVIGTRKMFLDPEVSSPAKLRVPNLGPWFSMSVVPKTGATKWKPSLRLLLNNRTSPYELTPLTPTLIATEHAFAGVGTFTIYPAFYWGGASQVFLWDKGAGALIAEVEAETGFGEWTRIDRVVGAAESIVTQRVVSPFGAWRVTLVAGGATEGQIAVTPFPTGSS